MTRVLARPAGLAVVWLLAAAGCSNNPTSPTSPTGSDETPAITTPLTVSFPGAVGPGGSVSRTFYAQVPGLAKAAVSGISPATPLVIGLGVPRSDGTGCLLAHSSAATGGVSAEVSGAVAVGTFCVQVFAPGQSANAVTFSVALEYP